MKSIPFAGKNRFLPVRFLPRKKRFFSANWQKPANPVLSVIVLLSVGFFIWAMLPEIKDIIHTYMRTTLEIAELKID